MLADEGRGFMWHLRCDESRGALRGRQGEGGDGCRASEDKTWKVCHVVENTPFRGCSTSIPYNTFLYIWAIRSWHRGDDGRHMAADADV